MISLFLRLIFHIAAYFCGLGVVFMANKYIVLDWQEVLYDEYMVFRKRRRQLCADNRKDNTLGNFQLLYLYEQP